MKKKVSKGYRKTKEESGKRHGWRTFAVSILLGYFIKKNSFLYYVWRTHTCAPTPIAQEINNNIIHRKEMTNEALVSHLGDYVWASLSTKQIGHWWEVQVFISVKIHFNSLVSWLQQRQGRLDYWEIGEFMFVDRSVTESDCGGIKNRWNTNTR